MFFFHFLWSNLEPVVQEEHVREVWQCELFGQGVGVLRGQDVRLECGEICIRCRKSAVLCFAVNNITQNYFKSRAEFPLVSKRMAQCYNIEIKAIFRKQSI